MKKKTKNPQNISAHEVYMQVIKVKQKFYSCKVHGYI